jgi:cytochrome c-type biogenesis protein CcmH
MATESQGQTPKWALPLLGAALVVLLVTLAYGALGGRAAKPEVNVTEAAEPGIAPEIDSLQKAVEADPDDADAWTRLGMAHFDRGEYSLAMAVLEHTVTLAPNKANLWSLIGQTRVYTSKHDPLPTAALDAFHKALAIDAKEPVSRYFMAVQKDLAKDHEGAISDMLGLLRDTPPGASWEHDLRRSIVQIGQINHIDVAARLAVIRPPVASPPEQAAMPGPTQDQIRDAARLSPSDQESMARGMVESLEGKLRADPKNVDRWIMLIRSRMTLGEPAKASAAYKAALAANPEAKDQIDGEARSLGVPR